MKKKVSITEFKSKCLSNMRDLDKKGAHIIITKHGKSIAEVQPVLKSESETNPLKGSVLLQKDIISPIETEWEVLQD